MTRHGIVGLIVAAVLAAPSALARDLIVGVEAIDYSPVYGWRDGAFTGAGREILDAFAADRGHRLTYRPLPVRRLLAELIHGGIDLKFPDNPEWLKAMRQDVPLAYSAPIIAYIDGTVVHRDRLGDGVAAVRRLGTIAGFTPSAWSRRISAGSVELMENPGFEPLLRQVAAGRIDGAYVNVAVGLHAAAQIADTAGTLVFDPALPHLREVYRLSSRTSPEIVAEFDSWLAANSGRVAAIIARTGAETGLGGGTTRP